jgi:4-amino-4-deoxy-L-arabinose transferase-like glycosyltransferase
MNDSLNGLRRPFLVGTRSLRNSACLFLLITLAVAVFLRLYHLADFLPILVDEAIYMRWAQIIRDRSVWFVSLVDGKPPALYWLYALIYNVSEDFHTQIRLVSVVFGIGAVLSLFFFSRRILDPAARCLLAILMALVPYSVLWDRLGYAEACVNFIGIVVSLQSIEALSKAGHATIRSTIMIGMALSLGIAVKQTVWFFAAIPILCWLCSKQWSNYKHILLCFGLPIVVQVALAYAAPALPKFTSASILLHRTDFLISFESFLSNPFEQFTRNFPLFWDYSTAYLGVPVILVSAASGLILLKRREIDAWVLSIFGFTVVTFHLFFVTHFPSRYLYPFAWIPVYFTARGFALARMVLPRAWFNGLVIPLYIVVAAGCAVRSWQIVESPKMGLSKADAGLFCGSHPFAGFGVKQAVLYLREAINDPSAAVLVDPYWGTPSDAIVAMLSRAGTPVIEAWWLELPDRQPLVPLEETVLMTSHYERISSGICDFRRYKVIYFVTDTGYFNVRSVFERCPTATIEACFLKPNGTDAIVVYRLR